MQKLSLLEPGKSDQAALTKRFAEAESLRRRFAGCKGLAELAAGTPDVKLHVYGKTQPRPRRKMGHITAMAATVAQAQELAIAARDALLI